MCFFNLLVLIWTSIIHVQTIFGIQFCYNFESCRHSTLSKDEMQCLGEVSCANSEIRDCCCGTRYEILCDGDHSCRDSFVYNSSDFEAYAAFSMYNTTIYAQGISLTGRLYGYYAGYGATIHCSNSSSCNFNCFGNGCVNLTVICDDTSSCSVTTAQQVYINENGLQPQYYRGLYVFDPFGLTFIDNGGTNANGLLCDSTTNDCNSETISIVNSSYNVYCVGVQDCRLSVITLLSNAHNSGVYCSADQSCYETSLIANQGSINNTIYCGGLAGCFYAKIIGFTNVYALGFEALSGAVIMSGNNQDNEMNVYLGAFRAAWTTANIICNSSDTCNIYCDVYQSCLFIQVKCYGICNIFCDADNSIECPPTVIYFNQTTYEPSTTATTTSGATTNGVTITTTKATTGGKDTTSTQETKGTQTDTTTQYETTETTQDPSGMNNNDDEDVENWLKTWEIGGYVCLSFSLILPVILCIIAHIYHSKNIFCGCDKPNYFSIFACCWNFGDFYSDLIFTFILISTKNPLWYFGLFFSFVPHFTSNFISLYSIRQWQNYNIYISKYVLKYDWIIIVVSVMAGFYSAIELARSQLFYLNMFSMQLKNYDYFKIQNFRFFNTVILELRKSTYHRVSLSLPGLITQTGLHHYAWVLSYFCNCLLIWWLFNFWEVVCCARARALSDFTCVDFVCVVISTEIYHNLRFKSCTHINQDQWIYLCLVQCFSVFYQHL